MFPSRIKTEYREEIIEGLNILGMSLHDLSRCCKYAHLNTKGDNYYELHLLYDEFVGGLDAQEDKVAESSVAHGGLYPTYCGYVMDMTVCHMIPEGVTDSKELLKHILECHGELDDYISQFLDKLILEYNAQTVSNKVTAVQEVIQDHIYKLQGFAV
jgi:DNA-binding ferritin-like protein